MVGRMSRVSVCLSDTGNGHIDFHELRTVLKSCMNESALKFSDDKLDELTRSAPPLGSSIVVLAL